MNSTIRRLDPQDPQDQKQLAELKKQPGKARVYLVSDPEPAPISDEETPEDILDEKSSTKATLDHLGRLIVDQRIDVLHCDPHQGRIWVRGRIDGRLQRIGSLPIKNYVELVDHLKIQANLELTDDVCQAGSLTWSFDDQTLTGQLQTVPTVNGEKLTFRRQLEEISDNLGAIGFWGANRRRLEQALGQTRGLILFVSPDQTSRQLCLETVESALAADHSLSLASLTDQPTVKYDHQTLLKPQWGRDRQQWLKTQTDGDSDVLIVDQLVGQASCRLAIEAALNNKLVLSSLAGQTTDEAIRTLAGQGVDSHLLAAARPTIVAVHLVGRLKARPKPKRRPGPAEWLALAIWDRFDFDNQPQRVEQLIDQAAQAATEIGGQLAKPDKTEAQDSDYRGRILLVETKTIAPSASPADGLDQNQKKPEVVDLTRDGLIKICLGLTSSAEVERVLSGRRSLADPA